jgi:hypothetical protein
MRTRLCIRRRLVVAAGTSLAVVGVVGGTAVTAGADPPALDPPSCTTTLARAHSWPGPIPTEDGLAPHFSDAFYSYLASLPECASGTGAAG